MTEAWGQAEASDISGRTTFPSETGKQWSVPYYVRPLIRRARTGFTPRHTTTVQGQSLKPIKQPFIRGREQEREGPV